MARSLIFALVLGVLLHHSVGFGDRHLTQDGPVKCPGAADPSCTAFAFLEILVTAGNCNGEAGADCTAVSTSQSKFKQAYDEWWGDGGDACDGGKAEAAATAVATAIAEVWANAASKVTCDGRGFACGWSAADGNTFALGFAEALAQAAADAMDGDLATAFCYADIRAVSVAIAEAAAKAQSDVCVTNTGTQEDYQNAYVLAVKAAIADAFAKATARACNKGDEVIAESECKGDATATTEEFITKAGDTCGGVAQLTMCSGSGNSMCCAQDFNMNLCRCEGCNGPWVKKSSPGDSKVIFEDKSKALCFCLDKEDTGSTPDETPVETASVPEVIDGEEETETPEPTTPEGDGEEDTQTPEGDGEEDTETPEPTTPEPTTPEGDGEEDTETPEGDGEEDTETPEPTTPEGDGEEDTETPEGDGEEDTETPEATTPEGDGEEDTETPEPTTPEGDGEEDTQTPEPTTPEGDGEEDTQTPEPTTPEGDGEEDTQTPEPTTPEGDGDTPPEETGGEEPEEATPPPPEKVECPGAVDTSCTAFASLEILVTSGGSCSGRAGASCTAVTESQSEFKEAYDEWWGDSGVCDKGRAEAAATAIAKAIAKVWADAAVQVQCEGKGFACGWAASGGEAWAIGFAEAMAQAAAEAGAGTNAQGFCYADIRAVSVVIAEAAAQAQEDACTNGDPVEVFESNYAAAIEVGIANAFAQATAEACDAGDNVKAKSKCVGDAASLTEGDSFATDDACAGINQVKACSGPGKDMCCDRSFKRNLCLCQRKKCENGPWTRKSDFDEATNTKRSFEDRKKNVCFCLD